MRLDQWIATLRGAAGPLDLLELHAGAERVAQRAQQLMANRAIFQVSRTATGVRISANPPSPLARRALDRALDEEMDTLTAGIAREARERLTSA